MGVVIILLTYITISYCSIQVFIIIMLSSIYNITKHICCLYYEKNELIELYGKKIIEITSGLVTI